MTMPLWPQHDLGPVQRGDIFALSRHRLACIDATDKSAVARLFAGCRPTLVVTSPPYADARNYNDPIPCWLTMMFGSLNGHQFASNVQLLVNLGVIHRRGEWWDYWTPWLSKMRQASWRHVGQYVWDKTYGLPGYFRSRPNPSHEFVFHLNKSPSDVNKCVATYGGRTSAARQGIRDKNGTAPPRAASVPGAFKSPDSVFRVGPTRFGEACGHPAQMPVALAQALLKSWKKPACVAYDPFGGSATTLLACEAEDIDGVASEISPTYVQMAIDRWRKLHPDKPVRRLTAPAPG